MDTLPPPYEIQADTTDAVAGHNAAWADAQRRWPGKKIEIMSEGVVSGKFVMVLKVSDGNTDAASGPSGETIPQGETQEEIRVPASIIVLIGDETGFGKDPISQPATPGKPVIVVTRGDAEDHRLIDGNWAKALNGDAAIWNQRLSWKYRTNTVVLYNPAAKKAIVEQAGLAATCELSDTSSDDTVEAEQVPDELEMLKAELSRSANKKQDTTNIRDIVMSCFK